MRTVVAFVATLLALLRLECSAFVFRGGLSLIPRNSHKLCSQIDPPASQEHKTDGAKKPTVQDVADNMLLNVSEEKLKEYVLPHLELPMGTQLFDGMRYCIPVLGQVQYVNSFNEISHPVTQALLAIVLRAKFDMHNSGVRFAVNPDYMWNMAFAPSNYVADNVLYAGPFTLDLTQLRAYLLICVDLFRSVDALATGKIETLEALETKYEPEVNSWEMYSSAFEENLAKRIASATVSTDPSSEL